MDRCWRSALLLVALLPLGCAKSAPTPAASQSPLAEHAERYAELPGLGSSPHPGLKAELALLVEERMTPVALDAQLSGSGASAGARTLSESIPAISRPLLSAQLDAVYAGGPLRLSPVQLERGREILLRCSAERQRFREALNACQAGLGLRPSDGVLADVTFLEAVALGCRLEAVAAADALVENQPQDAIAPLEIMFRAAHVLAGEWNVTTRTTAANLREDAFHVLEAIAAHEHATPEIHEQLLALVDRETAAWPADAAAWIGDRAAGLITYELVRDGYYFSLLEQSEIQKLREQGLVTATAKAVMRNIDADEHFYLQSMRRMIESCQQPYYERAKMLDEIRQDLTAREQTGDYPMVAARLLLTDFEAAHRRQAEDLARSLGWKLALAAALDRQPAVNFASPLTGEALMVQSTPQALEIGGIGLASESFRLPLSPVLRQARAPRP